MPMTAVDTADPRLDFPPETASYRDADSSSDDSGSTVNARIQPFLKKMHTKTSSYAEPAIPEATQFLTNRAAEPYLDPDAQYSRKQEDAAQKHRKAVHAAMARIQELKTDARAEDHRVSDDSEKDLLAFLGDYVFTRRPFITLLDNGNLRALWKNDAGEQIGIQFRGEKQVQYVFFAHREGQDFMARVSGRDSLLDIGRQIEALNLGRLMTA